MKQVIDWNLFEITPEKIHEPLICITFKGKLITLDNSADFTAENEDNPEKHYSNWFNLVYKYDIKYWLYLNDIIPEEYK